MQYFAITLVRISSGKSQTYPTAYIPINPTESPNKVNLMLTPFIHILINTFVHSCYGILKVLINTIRSIIDLALDV